MRRQLFFKKNSGLILLGVMVAHVSLWSCQSHNADQEPDSALSDNPDGDATNESSDGSDTENDESGNESQSTDAEGEESAAEPEPSEAALFPENPPSANTAAVPNAQPSSELAKPAAPPVSIPKVSKPNEFEGAPYLENSRRNLAGGEAPEEYVVEYGDSLFEICDQLLGDGDYWPKLWSLNTFIKNPHYIWPGMRLRFYPGDDSAPPYLQVVSEADAVAIPSENVDMASLVDEVFFAPSNLRNFVLDHVSQTEDFERYNGSIASFGFVKDPDTVLVTLPGFILGQTPQPFCEISRGLNGETLLAEGHTFFCEGERVSNLETGKSYTVLRPQGVNNFVNNVRGNLYAFIGNVKVEHVVNSERARGSIFHSRLALEYGDIVVPYHSTYRLINLKDEGKESIDETAMIVSFEEEGQTFGGRGQMIYIDKGEDDGIKVGQNLAIYQGKNAIFMTGGYPADSATASIGIAQIIDTTSTGAVAYITETNKEVLVGDQVGSF